jgi:hypothetical protein
MISSTGKLAFQINAAEWIVGEILDRIAKNLVVANHGLHVVRRIDSRRKQTQFSDRPRDTANRDEISNLERPQHNQEGTSRKICQQARPCHR